MPYVPHRPPAPYFEAMTRTFLLDEAISAVPRRHGTSPRDRSTESVNATFELKIVKIPRESHSLPIHTDAFLPYTVYGFFRHSLFTLLRIFLRLFPLTFP